MFGKKRRILFVDDQENVLHGIQRMLRPMRNEWDIVTATSGPQALDLLAGSSFDVIVSDMRMPGMDGAQLLGEVRARHPRVVRIILSGQADNEAILKTVGPAHQFLSKPCDPEVLKATVAQACATQDLLSDEPLQKLISRMKNLPSLPALYREVIQELQSPKASVQKIGQIISMDLGMTAKILQLVNSSFFALRSPVSSPAHAATLLGLTTVRALVLSTHVFTQFDSSKLPGLSIESLWNHSLRTAVLAKSIAKAEKHEPKLLDEAFTAGLLLGSGQLALAANLPDQYSSVLQLMKSGCVALLEAEQQVFGATHAEVGAYLLGLWGLPTGIVQAAAFHHRPSLCPSGGFTPLTAVHVASALLHEAPVDGVPHCSTRIDADYLAAIGCSDRLAAWQTFTEASARTTYA
jgi:HD-like signal output (HDOD) protein